MDHQTNNQNKTLFDRLISPALQYVGLIGAILTGVAYIALVIVLINGMETAQDLRQNLVFSVVNAITGFGILQFLKIQGVSFAEHIPENMEIMKEYWNIKTKDKKLRSIRYFFLWSTIKDFIFKCCTLALSTFGIVYLIITGSHNWTLMLLAIVNLIMFACFGILALNRAYEFYNFRHIPYIKEQIKINKETNDEH